MLLKDTRVLMDTFAEISCYSSDNEKATSAINKAFKEMNRLEDLFNKFDEKSEISRINSLAGQQKIRINSEVFKFIQRCVYYSRITDGAFDITVAPMKKGRYKDIVLDKEDSSIYFSEEDIEIDLGGVAKGYAVDRAKEILTKAGIKNALINIGGNMFAMGSPPHRDNWKIGIRDPENNNEIAHRLDLKDKAVATSGDYERPFHIIDPASGDSVISRASVTIVGDSAEKVDALSTAFFVMGPERTAEFMGSIKDVEAFIVDSDGNLVKYP
ncbi:MAG: FAD:protein FMN transferase [Candidatus Omnitrophica bacterium]|nr:FAD:protein FMN transferase [Candidatus Omnitrophota bacterium]